MWFYGEKQSENVRSVLSDRVDLCDLILVVESGQKYECKKQNRNDFWCAHDQNLRRERKSNEPVFDFEFEFDFVFGEEAVESRRSVAGCGGECVSGTAVGCCSCGCRGRSRSRRSRAAEGA